MIPWTPPGAIEALAADAARYGLAAVCVLPPHVARAAAILRGTRVGIAAAIAFPLGAAPPLAKAIEAEAAVRDGATELDIVLNLAAIHCESWDAVQDEVAAVERAAGTALTKWIVEESVLSDAALRAAVDAVADGGGDFVKSATGVGPAGASVPGIRRLAAVSRGLGLKAAGGIRTPTFARAMLAAGAHRLGSSDWRALLDRPGGSREASA